MLKAHPFLSKSVAALMLLGALPAAAGSSTYSGSLCASVSGTAAPTIFRSGRLINANSSAIEVVCPVQRDVAATFNESVSVIFTALDPHLTQDVCCFATVTEADGTPITSSSSCTSGANTTTSQSIGITVPTGFAGINGYISLRCAIPGLYTDPSGAQFSSALASFLIVE